MEDSWLQNCSVDQRREKEKRRQFVAYAGFVHVKKFCIGRSHGIRKSGTDMIEQEQRRYEMENWVQFIISMVLPSMKDEKMCWRSKSKHCSLARNSLVSESKKIQNM